MFELLPLLRSLGVCYCHLTNVGKLPYSILASGGQKVARLRLSIPKQSEYLPAIELQSSMFGYLVWYCCGMIMDVPCSPCTSVLQDARDRQTVGKDTVSRAATTPYFTEMMPLRPQSSVSRRGLKQRSVTAAPIITLVPLSPNGEPVAATPPPASAPAPGFASAAPAAAVPAPNAALPASGSVRAS
jgi:hypothetical protein